MKKNLYLILTVILLSLSAITLLATQSLASTPSTATVNGITWNYTLEDGNATNVYYESGNLPETLHIPAYLDGYPVVSLFNSSTQGNLFAKTIAEKNTTIKKINIPDTVTKIGFYAFALCENLEIIDMPESVTNIGHNAFNGCTSLTTLELSHGVTDIQTDTFYNCTNLASISIRNGITIEDYAFNNCPKLVIYCLVNSYAESYALKEGIRYRVDNWSPEITDVKILPSDTSKNQSTVTVTASDQISGLAKKAYSFDGGKTWQESNSFTCDNGTELIVQIRDKLDNTATKMVNVDTTIEKVLDSIEIKNAPTKTKYIVGEKFDKTGMIVLAKYSDETTKEISTYTITDGDKLALDQTSVTISYTENNITKTTKQKIAVTQDTTNNNETPNSETPKDDTVSKNKMPNAGLSNIIGLISCILIISTICYVKYKKYKNI